MPSVESHIVPASCSQKVRITDYCIGLFPSTPTKNAVKKAIKRALLLVDDQSTGTGHLVKAGDKITLRHVQRNFIVYSFNLPVIYEDDVMAIVHKPAGLETSNNKHKSLLHALPANLEPNLRPDAMPHPLPVHRLDYATEGLVVIAKTHSALRTLQASFTDRTVGKHYLAIASGSLPLSGVIAIPLDGKLCKTEYRLHSIVKHSQAGNLSLLKINLHTGRRNQIRRHLSMIGHPIIGDKKYNHTQTSGFRGLHLVAYKVSIPHPESGEIIQVEITWPKKFYKLFGQFN